jgi:hypothetical protein
METVIFLHIPKTAGSTLESILERKFPFRKTYDIYGYGDSIAKKVERLKGMPDSEKRKYVLIKGHYQFGLHEHLPQESTYITFLRNPIERIISHYNYVSNDSAHPLHGSIKDGRMTVEDYVLSGRSLELDNGQTRMISGRESESGFGQCSAEILEIAIRNIEAHFALVGLVERFEESMVLMKQSFGWNNVYYARKNVSRNGIRKSDLTPGALRTLEKHSLLDIELYRHAEKLLAEKVAARSEEVACDIARLRKYNRYYRPIDLMLALKSRALARLSR